MKTQEKHEIATNAGKHITGGKRGIENMYPVPSAGRSKQLHLLCPDGLTKHFAKVKNKLRLSKSLENCFRVQRKTFYQQQTIVDPHSSVRRRPLAHPLCGLGRDAADR